MKLLKETARKLRSRAAKLERWRLWLAGGALVFAAGLAFLALGLVLQGGGANDDTPGPATFRGKSSSVNGGQGSGPIHGSAFRVIPRVVTHRIIIPSIGVDAPVVALGMDDELVPDVPSNAKDVAWYEFSPLPGEGGNAVLGGHLNWAGDPGVFADLKDVEPGEIVRIIAADGREFAYRVTDNFIVDPTDPDAREVLAATETDTITLLTCGGTWVPDPEDQRLGGSYTDRIVVKADRIDDPQQRGRSFGF